MTPLYLASGSPRRRELLTQIGIPFTVVSASIDETPRAHEQPGAYVERLACGKAAAGLALLAASGTRSRLRSSVQTLPWCLTARSSVNPRIAMMPWPCWRRCPAANMKC